MNFPLTTTLNRIWACNPCEEGKQLALKAAGKHAPDDEPITYQQIVEAVEIEDALWCCRAETRYNTEWRLFYDWCTKQEQKTMADLVSMDELKAAKQYADKYPFHKTFSAARAAYRSALRASCAAGAKNGDAGLAAARESQREAFVQLVTSGSVSK